MEEILALIGEHHSFERTGPFDSTARRFAVASGGTFGIIPNESEPFCSAAPAFACLRKGISTAASPPMPIEPSGRCWLCLGKKP